MNKFKIVGIIKSCNECPYCRIVSYGRAENFLCEKRNVWVSQYNEWNEVIPIPDSCPLINKVVVVKPTKYK